MADSSVSFHKSTPTDNNLTENQISQNISAEKSPEYEVLYPKSTNNLNTPVKVDQPQSESRYNIHSTSTVTNSQSRNEIKSYVVWSIFNILCCCLPLGLFACYYSSRAKDLLRMRDIEGASKASKKARSINIIATFTGIIIILCYIVRFVIQLDELETKRYQTNIYSFY